MIDSFRPTSPLASTMSAPTIAIRKSPNDDREYRNVTLSNGLVVTLISDPTTDKAAASLDVNVGHFADPDNVPGIAHFLEHMLFLGTEDFPDENHYAHFLQENGGSSNAYTSCENTNYYFDVLQPHLGEVLKVFSAFFVNPLFTSEMTSRELKAVNSENAKNLLNDMWRSFQLQKSTADPDHPFSKFGTGNRSTLETIPAEKGINVRDVLLAFHKQWYSASIMKLCVLGRESLDELQAMVAPLFSRICNNNVSKQSYRMGSPYSTGDNLPRRLNVVPVKDIRTIELGWPTHPLEHLYRQKPAGYCSHVIGHEGPGSLFALLKEEGLADGLSCGMFQNNNGFGMFCISIEATDQGMARVNDVVNYCYQYIAMFRAGGSPEWIYKESQQIADTSFRFKEKTRPSSYVQSISSHMKTYTTEDTLCGSSLYFEFNAAAIQKIMDCFVPSNMRLQCTSRTYEGTTDLTEQWYKTKYSSTGFADSDLKEWSSPSTIDARLHLPQPNELVAKEFGLRCSAGANGSGVTGIVEGTPPPCTMIEETNLHRLWHKQDSEFGVPKCIVYLNILTPIAYDSPRSTVLSALYTELVQDALNEYSYDASVAGLNYQLNNTTRGLQITMYGYNDVMPTLLQKVTETMLTVANGTALKEERYALIRDRTILTYKNFKQDQPYQFAMYNTNYMTRNVRWHNEDKLNALQDDITIDSLKAFAPVLLQRAFCEAMVHGNVSSAEASSMIQTFEQSIGMKTLSSSQLSQYRCIQLPTAHHVHRQMGFDPENPESSIQTRYVHIVCDCVCCGFHLSSLISLFFVCFISFLLLVATVFKLIQEPQRSPN